MPASVQQARQIVRQIVRQNVRQIVRQILNLLPRGVMCVARWGSAPLYTPRGSEAQQAARLKSANVIYIQTTTPPHPHHIPALWATARPQAEARGALLLRGRLAVWTRKGRTRRPLSLRAHFPLSALRGSTGGRERKATSSLQGQWASATPYTWRDAQGTPRGCLPHEGSSTGPMERFCVAYTCGSGFSLLYVTEGPSPTSVYGGQGQGTLTRLES